MTCLVCGVETGSSIDVAGKPRPMCGTCLRRWDSSRELVRYTHQAIQVGYFPVNDQKPFARAFMDWLSRARAERRNKGAA